MKNVYVIQKVIKRRCSNIYQKYSETIKVNKTNALILPLHAKDHKTKSFKTKNTGHWQ